MDGADLRRSRWKDSALEEALLRYVNFIGGVWERMAVKECDFTESSMSEMCLKAVTLFKTDLTGAELFRTSLSGMDLTTRTLDRIVLSETCRELKGAVISAAQAAVVARILGIRVRGRAVGPHRGAAPAGDAPPILFLVLPKKRMRAPGGRGKRR